MKPMTIAWISLLFLGLIWGNSFLGAKLALQDFGPMSVSAGRISIAFLVIALIFLIRKERLPGWSAPTERRIWLHMIAFGILTNALPFTLLNWGQLYVTSGFAGITMAVVPLFTLPLAHLMIPGENLNLTKIAGFLLGFAGIMILIGPQALMTSTGENLEPFARLACVAATLCYALGSINTRLCPPISTLSYSLGGLFFGSLLMLPLALFAEGLPQTMPSSTSILALVALGVLPTAIATLILVWIINVAGPTFMSQVTYQIPVWAVISGVVFLGEDLPAEIPIAMVFIFAGLALSQGRFFRKRT